MATPGTDHSPGMVRTGGAGSTMPGMRSSLAAHLESRQVARVTYGAIIGLALIVALQGHPPGAGAMVGWLLATGVAVGLAEVYSEVVGAEITERHSVTGVQLKPMIGAAAAVAFGTSFPAVFFLVAAAHVIEVDTAFALAKWSGLGLIGLYGYGAARLAGAGVVRCLLHGAVVALVGAALIAFKSLLH